MIQLCDLGIPQTRSDLAEAESSLVVHLALYAWLGDQARMAAAYSSLGILYQALDDPEPAEAMFNEAVKLNESLGRRDDMAADLARLARLRQARDDASRRALRVAGRSCRRARTRRR